jgi:hypothetical protein
MSLCHLGCPRIWKQPSIAATQLTMWRLQCHEVLVVPTGGPLRMKAEGSQLGNGTPASPVTPLQAELDYMSWFAWPQQIHTCMLYRGVGLLDMKYQDLCTYMCFALKNELFRHPSWRGLLWNMGWWLCYLPCYVHCDVRHMWPPIYPHHALAG